MEIILIRKFKKENYTIGDITIDGEFICNSLEDKDYGFTTTTDPEIIKATKRAHPKQVAIPAGRYEVKCSIYCGMSDRHKWYRTTSCDGKIPRLYKVPGYTGILIHCGTTADHSAGCILVGYNTIKGMLTDSKKAFTHICDRIMGALNRGEKVWIRIV